MMIDSKLHKYIRIWCATGVLFFGGYIAMAAFSIAEEPHTDPDGSKMMFISIFCGTYATLFLIGAVMPTGKLFRIYFSILMILSIPAALWSCSAIFLFSGAWFAYLEGKSPVDQRKLIGQGLG